MSHLDKINQIDVQINSLRTELIRIIANINFTIGSDRRAILSQEYKQLKHDYLMKKEEISFLCYSKNALLAGIMPQRNG